MPVANSPECSRPMLKAEIAKWKRVIEQANVRRFEPGRVAFCSVPTSAGSTPSGPAS